MESGEELRLVVETAMNGSPELRLSLQPNDTIADLKHAIWSHSAIPPYHQALVFRGRDLGPCPDGTALRSLGLRDECRLKLLLLTRSGPLFFAKAPASPPAATGPMPSRRVSSVDTDTTEEAEEEEARREPPDYLRRWEEDRRTRARMRKLQEDMDRLRLEKGRPRIRGSELPGPSAAALPSVAEDRRPRRPLLSAPEDTSAKESSAGETEYEEWGPPGAQLPEPGLTHKASSALFQPLAAPADESSLASGRKPRGKAPMRVVSSSSEPESSGALWSESEGGGAANHSGLLLVAPEEEVDDEEEEDVYYSGLEGQEVKVWRPQPHLANLPSPAAQDTPSPSELSSGMLMCEWAHDHGRRAKVTRKRANQPKTTATRRAAAAEAAQGPSQTASTASAAVTKAASQRPRSKPRAGQLVGGVGAGPLGAGPWAGAAPGAVAEADETEALSSSSADEGRGKGRRGKGRGPGHRAPHSAQSQLRCHACAARLSLPQTFQCRCGKAFCARHRLPDLHTCPQPSKAPPPRPALPHRSAQQVSD